MRISKNVFLTAALALGAYGCSVNEEALVGPAIKSGAADFTKIVALGNSLTAGFADGALGEAGQKFSYPSLIAKQVNAPFNQPLIKEPGVGVDFQGNVVGRLRLVSLSPPVLVATPLNGLPQVISPPPYNNFAVPGADCRDVLTATSGGIADFILQGRGTQVRQAKAANPTFIIAWVGANDVLGAALIGLAIDGLTLTPTNQFSKDYSALIDSLTTSGARIVVANIPEVTVIPFVTTVKPYVVDPHTQQPIKDQQGNTIPLLGTFGDGSTGQLSDDPNSDHFARVTLGGAGYIAQGVGIPQGVGNGTGQPLPDLVLVDKAEIAKIKSRIAELNSIIAAATMAKKIPVMDAHELLNVIHEQGVDIGGVHLTTAFITGGIFGLDGIHLTPVGNGIAANAFIRRINEFYGSNVPEVNLAELLAQGGFGKIAGEPQMINPYAIPHEAFGGVIRMIAGHRKL
jgi:lysophospholipase L1-like esterase